MYRHQLTAFLLLLTLPISALRASIVPVEQSRSVGAYASAWYYNYPPDTEANGFICPDFAPFVQTVRADAAAQNAGAHATASQDSRFTDVAVLANGTVTFSLITGTPTPHDGGCQANGSSPMRLTFDLSEPAAIALSGTISLGDWYLGSGTAKVELLDAGHQPVLSQIVSTGIPASPRIKSFADFIELPAGRYTVAAEATPSALTWPVSGPTGGTVSYSFTMQIVPEPVGISFVVSGAMAYRAVIRRRNGRT
jgi:hypothetical protein